MDELRHELTYVEHPSWCDPVFCTAPKEPFNRAEWNKAPKNSQHHSTPMQLDRFAGCWHPIGLTTETYATFANHGTFAWLTQAVAPWSCSTYLNIGAYEPSKAPAALFHLPMEPNHLIDQRQPLSAGERLPHLCRTALSEAAEAARAAVDKAHARVLNRVRETMVARGNEAGRCLICDGVTGVCQVCHKPRHDADADHELSLLPCRECNGGAYPVRPAEVNRRG